MSVLREFAFFTHLPHELQNAIWSHSFWPQIITLQYTGRSPTSHTSIESNSSEPTLEAPSSSKTPPSPAQLEPVDTRAPAAFSVCRASREIAQSKDYRTWKLVHSDGRERNLLWNPLTDIVFLPTIESDTLNLFADDFAAQAGEIRNLALPYSFWDQCYKTMTRNHLWPRSRSGAPGMEKLLKKPSSMQSLFVIVDKGFFETEVEGKTEDQLDWWIAPWAIGKGYYELAWFLRKLWGEDCQARPKISVAWNFEMILRGDDVELPECSISLDHFESEQEWQSRRNR